MSNSVKWGQLILQRNNTKYLVAMSNCILNVSGLKTIVAAQDVHLLHGNVVLILPCIFRTTSAFFATYYHGNKAYLVEIAKISTKYNDTHFFLHQ